MEQFENFAKMSSSSADCQRNLCVIFITNVGYIYITYMSMYVCLANRFSNSVHWIKNSCCTSNKWRPFSQFFPYNRRHNILRSFAYFWCNSLQIPLKQLGRPFKSFHKFLIGWCFVIMYQLKLWRKISIFLFLVQLCKRVNNNLRRKMEL